MVTVPDDLVEHSESKIVLVVADGLGGLPHPDSGLTELEAASTPNLDRLARSSSLGMLEMVKAGVTPGSGPGHLALFGYDPTRWMIGRGVLSALGVGFDLREGDLAARLNFATLDADGRVQDRRAGRLDDEEGRRLVGRLNRIKAPSEVELFIESEKEHRAVMILRGPNLSASLSDTDPQGTGVPPLHVRPLEAGAEKTARVVQDVLDAVNAALADEPKANCVLARGFATYQKYPTMEDRYMLRSLALAGYPMYRGVARLLGMEVEPAAADDENTVKLLTERFAEYDFFFVHFKAADSRGEDGDFAGKVSAIEAVDGILPEVEALEPDVLVVTGDHSTPSLYGAHSWHPVPVLLWSKWARPVEVDGFGERQCLKGDLGLVPASSLMTLALAHAGRLSKFGA